MELGDMLENPGVAGGKRGPEDDALGAGKRRRRSGGAEAAFEELLAESGCELSTDRNGHEFEVLDARKLRRQLEQKLTLNTELRKSFMEGLAEVLQDGDVLHAALRPMPVMAANAPITGDSLARVLLNVAPLQNEVAALLLEKLSEFDGGGSEEERMVPQLILGQFRWLDHVVDSHQLTEKVLEVVPAWPPELQREAITFLPEIAPEEDYEAVLRTLENLMEGDSSFILPVIEAVSSLSIGAEMQGEVVEMVLARLQSAEPQDLPQLVRFLLQNVPIAMAKTVVQTLRESLHFVTLSDPRLAVPDRKQKGRALGAGDNPEYQMLDAIKQGMQLNPVAADVLVKEIKALAEPAQHKALDFWVLLLLLSLGPERRKAAEAMLRKKLADGHADAAWMERAIAGHEKAMGEFFPALLSLAQQLVRAASGEVSAAGAALFVALFTHFTGAYYQQEVLRALHSHLGAHVSAEADTALGVLGALARGHTAGLMRYAAFLTNILDYLDGYSDAQTHQVFAVFSELVAGTCQQQDETGGGGERSRMEDELFIFLRKQLAGAQASHRRVGIIGVVTLVQRLGATLSGGNEDASAIGKRYQEAMAMLRASFEDCRRAPDSFAFLCDELARSIQQQRVSPKLMRDLSDSLTSMFEESFIADPVDGAIVQVGAAQLSTTCWWNLDGTETPASLKMLPFLAEQVAMPTGGSARNPLIYMFSTIRLMATMEAALNNNRLESIDALLGCPVALFPMDLASPAQFGKQPSEVQRVVLLGVFYALNWYRELVNAFAAQLDLPGQRSPADKLELKLLARLRGICQLEALLDALLAQAPALFVLPVLSNTLDAGPGAALAPSKRKPPAKKAGDAAKSKGKGKKGVKFEDGDGEEGSTKRGGSETASKTASGGTQTGGAGSATQGAAAAAAGGLSRLNADRSKFRSLLLPALGALGVGGGAGAQRPTCYAMLAPAGYLLADLHGKLKAVLHKAKRPSFLLGRGAAKPALPADLRQITPTQLLGAVRRALPSLRHHLDVAVDAMTRGLSDAAMEEVDEESVWGSLRTLATQSTAQPPEASTFLVELPDNSAAAAAVSPSAAAPRVATLALECIRQLLTFQGITVPASRPVLQAMLGTFSMRDGGEQGEAGEDAWTAEELLEGCRGAFTYFAQCLPGADDVEGEARLSFEHCHSILLILGALTGVARELVQGLPPSGGKERRLGVRMGERVSNMARTLLSLDWKEAGQEGNGWKGRNAALSEMLHMFIGLTPYPALRNLKREAQEGGARRAADRLQLIKDLANDVLSNVTAVTTGKANAEPSDDYPSLSGATLAVWYRVALEELQALWEAKVGEAAQAEKGRGLMDDEEMVGELVGSLGKCAEAFALLMQLVKVQDKRTAIHTQAVKSAGKFLETSFRALPFWAAATRHHSEACLTMVRDMQKGTKIIQVLCSEGKHKRELPLAAKVPQVKRSVERFLFKVQEVVLADKGAGQVNFFLGNLKHKNLQGHEVPSQMYPEGEGGSDEEEDEGEEEGEEEEDQEEETGETQGYGKHE